MRASYKPVVTNLAIALLVTSCGIDQGGYHPPDVLSSQTAQTVLVSGPMTGQGVETADLKIVKDAVQGTPVFANTGVTIDTVAGILKVGDGAIVGTHFKIDGNTWNAVDRGRVARFMDKVRKLRS